MLTNLFNIPLVPWVQQTIQKMNAIGKDDMESWSHCWFETYKELGGKSNNSGVKGCPKHAAYGLWCLGRIEGGGKTFEDRTIQEINESLGKNTSYAILALDLLESSNNKNKDADYTLHIELWPEIQELYQQKLGKEPAKSEQGAIKIAVGLFKAGKIISRP